jgi:hypothetical protein
MSIPVLLREPDVPAADEIRLEPIFREAVTKINHLLGARARLPPTVTLASPKAAYPGQGVTVMTFERPSWRLKRVDPPVVKVLTDNVALYSFVHEMAHYSEATLRLESDLHLQNGQVTEMWTEYFAHRTCCEAGLLSVHSLAQEVNDFVAALSDSPPVASSEEENDSGISKMAYYTCWVLAELDVYGAVSGMFTEEQDLFLRQMNGRHGAVLADAYRSLPAWKPRDLYRIRHAVEGIQKALKNPSSLFRVGPKVQPKRKGRDR